MKHNKDLDRYELSIVRAFAGAVQCAYEQYGLDICDYLIGLFKTDIFNRFEEEHTVYVQGYHCIAGILLDEVKKLGITVKQGDDNPGDAPVAYWMGYLFMYWKLLEHEMGNNFLKYDLEGIYWSYESLHTMSIPAAIDSIKLEYIEG